MTNPKNKPEYDRLTKRVQVLLKSHEYKILERLQRESSFPSIAAFVRAIILDTIKRKKQTELF